MTETEFFSYEESQLLERWLHGLIWKGDVAHFSAESGAVANLLLNGIQQRLPQWAVVHEDGSIDFNRKVESKRSRKINLYPQFLFEINWCDSGPGFSNPDAYHAVYLPTADLYAVTASTDSESSAIGAFRGSEFSTNPVGTIIRNYWQEVYNQGGNQEPWEEFLKKGLVTKSDAASWCYAVFGDDDSYEEDDQWVEPDKDSTVDWSDVEGISPYQFPADKTVDTLTHVERMGLWAWLQNEMEMSDIGVRFGWLPEDPNDAEPKDSYFSLHGSLNTLSTKPVKFEFHGPEFPTIESAFDGFLDELRWQRLNRVFGDEINLVTDTDHLDQIIAKAAERKEQLEQGFDEEFRITQLMQIYRYLRKDELLYTREELPISDEERERIIKRGVNLKRCRFLEWQRSKKWLWVTVKWDTGRQRGYRGDTILLDERAIRHYRPTVSHKLEFHG